MRWLPYCYQYSVMLLFFIVGTLLAVRHGQLPLNTKHGKRYMFILISGFIGYMALQGFLQFIAPLI